MDDWNQLSDGTVKLDDIQKFENLYDDRRFTRRGPTSVEPPRTVQIGN